MSITDSKTDNSVVVKIFGEEYPIAGTSDPAYISKVADIVDSRMREVAGGSGIKARDKVAILTALSFASELCESGEDLKNARKGDSGRVSALVRRIDAVLAK